MEIQLKPYPIQISQELIDIVASEIRKTDITGENGVCIVFKDKSYSTEKGGFHPVEISIKNNGRIIYITDFAYKGMPPMAELCKELDFDIAMKIFQMNDDCYPIEQSRSMFRIWQSNFCAYYRMGVFDEIRVTEGIWKRKPVHKVKTPAEAEVQ